MGIYLNPDNEGFLQSIRSEIYVDKTGLIAYTNKYLNTEQKYICVSRPRRFGKSMALKMLAAYYSLGCSSAHLFKGLKIEKDKTFQEYLNQYDVIFLNMQQFLIETKKQEVTEYIEQEVGKELCEEYGEFENAMSVGGWSEVMRVLKASERMLEDTLLCDEKSVATGLDNAYAGIGGVYW